MKRLKVNKKQSPFLGLTKASISPSEAGRLFGVPIGRILALIVMYDAGVVQQSVGRQSVALNRIIIMLKRREPLVKIEADLRELIGHAQFEIIVGVVLGIAIARLWLFFAGIQAIEG